MSYEHVVAGLLRHVSRVDAKRMPPSATYLSRYSVDRWLNDHNGSKTMLTVIHVLIPQDKLINYTDKVKSTFQSWLSSVTQLVSKHSLDDLLYLTLEDHRSAFFVMTLDFTDDTGRELSFERTVEQFNQSVPLYPDLLDGEATWKVVGRTLWDNRTSTEMPASRSSTATSVQSEDIIAAHTGPLSPTYEPPLEDQPTTSYTRDDDDDEVMYINSYVVSPSDTEDDIPEQPTTSYTRDDDLITPTLPSSDTDDDTMDEYPITACTNPEDVVASVSPSTTRSVAKCTCCFNTCVLCVFDCGHIMCKNCIDASKKYNLNTCGICRTEWKAYRPLIATSVSQTVCGNCSTEKMYIMPCGHATCSCPDRVCHECHGTVDLVRVYVS